MITRPEPGASETAGRLIKLGFCPVLAPVLSIIIQPFNAPRHVSATLLTSRNVIQACPSFVYPRPAFAVGTSTAVQAQKAGFAKVLDANGDAKSLVRLVADTLAPAAGPLLLPAGQGQGAGLAESLQQLGYHVIRRIAYQTNKALELPEAAAISIQRDQLTAAMFFSGETSRHFVHLLNEASLAGAVHNVEAVSISEPAAMALRRVSWRRISVADRPNQEAMLAMLNHD